MFGFFKKRKKKDGWQEIFEVEEKRYKEKLLPVLQAVAEKLPNNYLFIKNVLASQFIKRFGVPFVQDGREWYTFTVDQDLYTKFRKGSDNYALQNIRIYSNSISDFATLELLISKNIPIGFSFACSDWDFDLSKIDTSSINEYRKENSELKKWAKIIGPIPVEFADIVDLENGIEIEIEDILYFTITDFGDGDYLAVRENKEIYGFIHGKNLIEKIFDTPKEFFHALQNNSFDINQYYNSRV